MTFNLARIPKQYDGGTGAEGQADDGGEDEDPNEELWICPTMDKVPSGTSRDHTRHFMAVNFYLRLELRCEGGENFWDSNEVYLIRAGLPKGAGGGAGMGGSVNV